MTNATEHRGLQPLVVPAPILIPVHVLDRNHLSHTAALRVADHHLGFAMDDLFDPSTSKNEEMFCVSQSSTVSATDFDLSLALLKRQALDYMWVQEVGSKSLTFGHAIVLPPESSSSTTAERTNSICLALASRVYVRLDRSTQSLISYTEEDREKFAMPREDWSWAQQQFSPLLPPLPNRTPWDKSIVLGDSDPFSVEIGPHHANENHVDHAALADIVVHAALRREPRRRQDEMVLSVQYVSPPSLWQTLTAYSIQNERDRSTIFLTKQGPKNTPELVVQGQAHWMRNQSRL